MANAPKSTTAIGFISNLPITDPKSLFAQQIEVPELRPHDLLVEIEAVSVNPVDVKLRAGARAGAPSEGFRVLAFDGAGVVRAVGESVELFQPGDEVAYAGSIDRPGPTSASTWSTSGSSDVNPPACPSPTPPPCP